MINIDNKSHIVIERLFVIILQFIDLIAEKGRLYYFRSLIQYILYKSY